MQKISYNEQDGMQQAVVEGYKLMTRREPIFEEIKEPARSLTQKGIFTISFILTIVDLSIKALH